MHQQKRASGTRKDSKNIKVSVSAWSSHNEYSNNAKTNNFVAWKQGHVAAVLSRDQHYNKEYGISLSKQHHVTTGTD